ncbi:MAG: tol-pal system-associated acyl-CoA thioesterase [Rhodospirillales bacterium]
MMAPASDPPAGAFDGDAHLLPIRVYYEDTDAAGLVYYANYLRFAERARTEMMRMLGVDHPGLMATDGVVFAVRHCSADYLAPARLDDPLQVVTRLAEVRGVSLTLDQRVRRDGTDLVRIGLKLVCMTLTGRPARIPAALRARLATHLNRSNRST